MTTRVCCTRFSCSDNIEVLQEDGVSFELHVWTIIWYLFTQMNLLNNRSFPVMKVMKYEK